MTPDDIHQYAVAGQPLDEDPPSHHFPHAPGSKVAEIFSDEDRDHVKPRGLAATKTATLRQQHLAVITAILHRCIMNRDFERASRALGMILRDEVGGQTVDIRTHGRWGIGAEILLRKGQAADRRSVISRSGFELARRYYERLVVQHPFSKNAKNAYDERDFYLALMGLWIYTAHQEGKMIREGNAEGEEEEEEVEERRNHEAGTQRELIEARSIAQRLDGLMISPLYSLHREFIRLRAMVALWIADLARDTEDFHSGSDLDNLSSEVETELVDSISGVVLNDYGDDERRRRKPPRNLEAEQAEMRAKELFALLRQRFDDDMDGD